MSILAIAVSIIALVLFGAFVLLGAWIDGRRQAIRNKGLHPVTTPNGQVESQEFEAFEALELETREQANGTGSQNHQS
jgi:hypothetical protein